MIYAIVGARKRKDREAVTQFVDSLAQDDVVISGDAKGVDSWAIEAARRRGLETRIYQADTTGCKHRWEYANAYYARNARLAMECNILVAFVAPERKGGTENTIRHAQKLKRRIIIK